jgi:predicted transglutaminase-like cysteine proteinase
MMLLVIPQVGYAKDLVSIEESIATTKMERMTAWAKMNASIQNLPELEKLEVVNQFYNQIPFSDDQSVWQQHDYWASPQELLSKNVGDCEDYAIAKYFSLINAGVSEKKLSLVYVQLLPDRDAHMVLSYLDEGQRSPVILDNFVSEILSTDSRSDLVPVYSFNGSDMWIVDAGFSYTRVGSAERIKLWRQLKQRMAVNSGVAIALR